MRFLIWNILRQENNRQQTNITKRRTTQSMLYVGYMMFLKVEAHTTTRTQISDLLLAIIQHIKGKYGLNLVVPSRQILI